MALKLIVIDRIKTDNVTEALRGLTNRPAADEKTVAERQWQGRKLAPAPQKPCDHGLFSDEANQLDLVEMFQDPTNGE